jgi:hypothetical protein
MNLSKDQNQKIKDFCDEHSLEYMPNYSGRGMYGDTCIGIVTSGTEFGLGFHLAMHLKDDPELIEVFKDGGWTDNMGYNMIVYFRGVHAPQEAVDAYNDEEY